MQYVEIQFFILKKSHKICNMILELFAYIDPGSGFGIAQILTALAGALFVYKAKVKEKIKSLTSKFNRKSKGAEDSE